MAAVLLYILTAVLNINLRCSFIEGLVTPIDITVEGDDVLKSGVRRYTIHGWNTQSFTIKCTLNTAVAPNEVQILDKRDRPEYSTTSRRMGFTSQWSKVIYVSSNRGSRNRDKYTCKALLSVNSRSIVNGSQWYSVIYSEVEIEYVTRNQFTAFSVGLSAYTGEEVFVTCKGNRYVNGKSCELVRDSKAASIINIPYGYNNNERQSQSIGYDCGYFYTQCTDRYTYYQPRCNCLFRKCDKLYTSFDIWSHLELSLTPLHFPSNVTAMQFNCTSVPPRLMHWTIITTNGYILDFKSLDNVIKVSMNVTIKQKPGETLLNISETSAGDDKIQTVMCSSYDTVARVVVSSHRMVIDDEIDRDSVLTSTQQTTLMYQQPTTTTECKSNPQTGAKHIVATDSDPQASYKYGNEGEQSNSSAEPIYVNLLVIVIATLAVIVCGLTIVVVMMCRRISGAAIQVAPSPRDADTRKQGTETDETVLHDNPIYSSYSDKVDAAYFPSNTEQDDSCMYINI